jgi:hypothetical protein
MCDRLLQLDPLPPPLNVRLVARVVEAHVHPEVIEPLVVVLQRRDVEGALGRLRLFALKRVCHGVARLHELRHGSNLRGSSVGAQMSLKGGGLLHDHLAA